MELGTIQMAKAPADLRSLARGHTSMGVRVLADIAQDNDAPEPARVSAIALLFDRGWGKPPTTHTGADGDGDIKVIIRHIVEGRDGVPMTIEQEPKLLTERESK